MEEHPWLAPAEPPATSELQCSGLYKAIFTSARHTCLRETRRGRLSKGIGNQSGGITSRAPAMVDNPIQNHKSAALGWLEYMGSLQDSLTGAAQCSVGQSQAKPAESMEGSLILAQPPQQMSELHPVQCLSELGLWMGFCLISLEGMQRAFLCLTFQLW